MEENQSINPNNQSPQNTTKPKVTGWKRAGLILVAVLLVVAARVPKTYLGYFAYSEKNCDSIFPFNIFGASSGQDFYRSNQAIDDNINCKKLVNEGRTLFTLFKKDTAIKDTDCEKESYTLRSVCYFKKAVDNHEPRYCSNLISKNFCLLDLAIATKDNSVCKQIDPLYAKRCNELADICKNDTNTDPGCKGFSEFRCPAYYEWGYDTSKKEALDCVQKYGKEYEGVPIDLTTDTPKQ